MRLDKFLKLARIIKRRTVAKEVTDQGRVLINQHPAKSGSQVKVGDQITIDFANKELTIEVLALMDSPKKEEASSMYKIHLEKYKPNSAYPEFY